jgi:hypothetical protein
MCPQISVSRVQSIPVVDGSGKEFQEPARYLVAGVADDRRHHDRGRDGRGDPGRLGCRDDGQLAGRSGVSSDMGLV